MRTSNRLLWKLQTFPKDGSESTFDREAIPEMVKVRLALTNVPNKREYRQDENEGLNSTTAGAMEGLTSQYH